MCRFVQLVVKKELLVDSTAEQLCSTSAGRLMLQNSVNALKLKHAPWKMGAAAENFVELAAAQVAAASALS